MEKPQDTRQLEHANFGTYWQTVRDQEHLGLNFTLPQSDLAEKVEHIRTLNPEKGVYGGNGWANYAAAYFNDCYRFAQAMQYVLKPGSKALVVIGNSILQGVDIPTDLYLSQIAEAAGLELLDIHTPRATRVGNSIIQSEVRVAKAQKGRKLYEAVVELRKRLPLTTLNPRATHRRTERFRNISLNRVEQHAEIDRVEQTRTPLRDPQNQA